MQHTITTKSVKTTRRRGKTHFFVIKIPMAYILAYIFIQTVSGDYKEVATAVVALRIAFYIFSEHFGVFGSFSSSKNGHLQQ